MPRKATRSMGAAIMGDAPAEKTTTQGLEAGFKRTTIIVREDRFRDLQLLAKLSGQSTKDVLDEAITEYLAKNDLVEKFKNRDKKEEEQ